MSVRERERLDLLLINSYRVKVNEIINISVHTRSSPGPTLLMKLVIR